MVAPIDTSALVDLMSVPIDIKGLEFALGIVFSVPVALVLGLLVGLIAWAVPRRPSLLRSIEAGAGLGIAAGLVGTVVSWVTMDAWDSPGECH